MSATFKTPHPTRADHAPAAVPLEDALSILLVNVGHLKALLSAAADSLGSDLHHLRGVELVELAETVTASIEQSIENLPTVRGAA